jgi:hypothetical protein
LFLLSLFVNAWACPNITNEQVVTSAHAVELAYASFDEAVFTENIGLLRGSLDCLDATLTSAEILSIHKAVGLLNFANGDDDLSVESWRSVRSLSPSFVPPADLMPENSPLRNIFTRAEPSESIVAISPLQEGAWHVDGQRVNAVPTQRAFVLVAASDHQVLYSGYHYSPFTVPLLEDVRKTETAVTQRKAGVLATAVFGVLAGTALGLRQQQIQALQSSETDPTKLYEIRANANGFTVAAEVLAGSALIAGGYTFFLSR